METSCRLGAIIPDSRVLSRNLADALKECRGINSYFTRKLENLKKTLVKEVADFDFLMELPQQELMSIMV
jgi:hypothetical protein